MISVAASNVSLAAKETSTGHVIKDLVDTVTGHVLKDLVDTLSGRVFKVLVDTVIGRIFKDLVDTLTDRVLKDLIDLFTGRVFKDPQVRKVFDIASTFLAATLSEQRSHSATFSSSNLLCVE